VLALLLYALTGLATGVQLGYLLSWAIWGAPTSPLQYVALLGSVALLVAAVLSMWKPRAATTVALGGSLLLWCFYGPALYTLWREPPLSFRFNKVFVVLLPLALLIAVTGYAGPRALRPAKAH